MNQEIKNILKSIYRVCVPRKFRYGTVYREYCDLLEKSQYWSKDRLEEYQLNRLKDLLNHSYSHVPYYRDLFNKNGINPKDIKDFSDYRKIPCLDKFILNDHRSALIADNLSENQLDYASTGGSTAIQVGFYREKGRSQEIEKAFIHRRLIWAGFRPENMAVSLETSALGLSSEEENGNSEKRDARQKSDKYYWYNALENRLLFSYRNLSEKTLPIYIEQIRKYKPEAIRGYPSSSAIFARLIEEQQIKDIQIPVILTSSETLYPAQRQLLERVFHGKVFDYYGHSERTVAAAECSHHQGYHIFPEYGILELIDSNENPVTKDGELGRIVGTGLHNYAMPLLRYRTDDLAVYSSKKCSCGRELPMLEKIQGRLQELILTSENRVLSMTSINMHSDIFDKVQQFQFVQDQKGELLMKIIKKSNYTDRDSERILDEIHKITGSGIKTTLDFVNEIPLTRLGKHRFLIQNLPVDSINRALGVENK